MVREGNFLRQKLRHWVLMVASISLQVTISACNSGGFAHEDFVKPHLQGTWSVTAARDVEL
jgi:hypothetical protein